MLRRVIPVLIHDAILPFYSWLAKQCHFHFGLGTNSTAGEKFGRNE
jgi:hypothetical protein